MMIDSEIVWTSMERADDGSGDTRYFGCVNGERLYVIKGTGPQAAGGRGSGRRFRAFRLTADGTEYPVAEGGDRRHLWAAKECCAAEFATYTPAEAEAWLTDRRERRELVRRVELTGRSAAGLTLAVLRDLVEPAVEQPIRLARTVAGPLTEVRFDAELPPLPTPTTAEYDDGEVVWRLGDRVLFSGPVFEPGDVWRVETIYVPIDKRPYAELRLAGRVGGLPVGTTRTGISLLQLTRYAEVPPQPGPVEVEIGKLRAAFDLAARSRDHNRRRADDLQLEVDELRARIDRPLGAARTHGDVLRKLRDDHLPSWLRGCMENDEARQIRDRETDPERYPLLAADVRTMIVDCARELGVEL